MKAFNVNDSLFPFTEMILNGVKIIETRRTKSLHSLIGSRVGIIKTGCGKAMLVGYVDIVDVIKYNTVDDFRADYYLHRVEPGCEYDIEPCGIKYGYLMQNPVRCNPTPVFSKGIVIRNI